MLAPFSANTKDSDDLRGWVVSTSAGRNEEWKLRALDPASIVDDTDELACNVEFEIAIRRTPRRPRVVHMSSALSTSSQSPVRRS